MKRFNDDMYTAFFAEDTTTIKLDVIKGTIIRTRLMKLLELVPSDATLTYLVDIVVERLKDKLEHGFYMDGGLRDKIGKLTKIGYKFRAGVVDVSACPAGPPGVFEQLLGCSLFCLDMHHINL